MIPLIGSMETPPFGVYFLETLPFLDDSKHDDAPSLFGFVDVWSLTLYQTREALSNE